jgi:hypothetical protein
MFGCVTVRVAPRFDVKAAHERVNVGHIPRSNDPSSGIGFEFLSDSAHVECIIPFGI